MNIVKFFFQKLNFEKIQNNLKTSFKNFPIPFISIILIFGVLEFLVLKGAGLPDYIVNILGKGVLSLIVIYFLGIGVKLFLEDKNGGCRITERRSYMVKKRAISFLPIIFGLLFFFNFEENLFNNSSFEELLYVVISIIGVLSFLFISKFIKIMKIENGVMAPGIYKNENYFGFFTEKIGKIGVSIFSGLALMILGFIALWAVFGLFEIGNFLDEGKIFGFWAVFSLSFFAPLYFLGNISKNKSKNNLENGNIQDNKIYNFFSNYLFLPAIIIYFIILYSYLVKVLINFQNWPEGMISWLIIFFSLFGYLVYIFTYPLVKISNLAKIFRKYFPLAVLFQLPMFFYAIFLRINQYDFTINRYLLLAFGIYLLVISLYFIFSQKKKLMSIFGILFLFITLISVSGNFSVYKFSENRQLNLLEKNLIEAKILIDGKIFLPEKNLSKKFATEIYHKVDYLCDFHGCNVMGKIFPELLKEVKKDDFEKWEKNNLEEKERFQKAIEEHGDEVERTKINKRNLKKLENEEYVGINSRDYKNEIIKKLKVENYYYKEFKESNLISVTLDHIFRTDVYDVAGRDYFFRIQDNYQLNYYLKNIKESDLNYDELYYGKYDFQNGKLNIFKGDEKLEEVDLLNDFENFYEDNKKYIETWGLIKIKKPFFIEKKGSSLDVKIILEEFNILNKDKDVEIEEIDFNSDINYVKRYLNGVILIKEK